MSAGRARPAASVIVAMGVIYVVWGSTYPAIRVSVRTLPPYVAAGVRFLLAGLIVAVFVRLRGGATRPTAREAAGAAVVGAMLLVGGVGSVTIAETHVPSNLAAVLASLTSVWIVVYRLLDGERLRPVAAAAVVVGFGGVAVLLLPGSRPAGVGIGWLLLCVASSLCWSSGSYYGTRLPLPADAFVAATIEMLAGALALLVVAVASGQLGDVELGGVSFASFAALVYLVVAGAVAFTAYVWLLDRLPISVVVTHQYVNPLVAVALGVLLLGERLTATTIAGAALVVTAVFVLVREVSASNRAVDSVGNDRSVDDARAA